MTTRTVNDTFEWALNSAPQQGFVDFHGEGYTYEQVDTRVAGFARGLRTLGVKPGDRVLTMLDNEPDLVFAWLAANRVGAIWVPLNTMYKGEFLRHQIADSGARVIVAGDGYVPRLELVREGIPELATVITTGSSDDLKTVPGWRRLPVSEAMTLGSGDATVKVEPSELATIYYTSGTTGPSKGCMTTHQCMTHVGRLIGLAADRQPDELHWTPLPLFHVGGSSVVMSTMGVGGSASIASRFSVRSFWPEIERCGARVVSVLATMIPLIAQAADTPEMERCRGQIRVALGIPFPAELQAIWQKRFGVQIAGFNAWGLTEAPMATIVPGGRDAKPGSAGRRHQWVDVRIFDEQDREVPPGVVGEIVCRPLEPHVMFEGYWNRPADTLAQLRNLWFHTGDLGTFDEDGFLHYVDRQKDCLRRRGENISSFEMETAFLQHPAISEAAVHAVPSELAEDDVKITAVLAEPGSLSPEELLGWAVDHVPEFALPRYVEFRHELPKNPVGRVLKYQLREDGVTPTTWDRALAEHSPFGSRRCTTT